VRPPPVAPLRLPPEEETLSEPGDDGDDDDDDDDDVIAFARAHVSLSLLLQEEK